MLTEKQIVEKANAEYKWGYTSEEESAFIHGATWASEQNAADLSALKSTIEEIYFLLCDGKTGAAKSLADTTLSKLEK